MNPSEEKTSSFLPSDGPHTWVNLFPDKDQEREASLRILASGGCSFVSTGPTPATTEPFASSQLGTCVAFARKATNSELVVSPLSVHLESTSGEVEVEIGSSPPPSSSPPVLSSSPCPELDYGPRLPKDEIQRQENGCVTVVEDILPPTTSSPASRSLSPVNVSSTDADGYQMPGSLAPQFLEQNESASSPGSHETTLSELTLPRGASLVERSPEFGFGGQGDTTISFGRANDPHGATSAEEEHLRSQVLPSDIVDAMVESILPDKTVHPDGGTHNCLPPPETGDCPYDDARLVVCQEDKGWVGPLHSETEHGLLDQFRADVVVRSVEEHSLLLGVEAAAENTMTEDLAADKEDLVSNQTAASRHIKTSITITESTTPRPPNPKRPTMALQDAQRRKLTTPFRPPTLLKKCDGLISIPTPRCPDSEDAKQNGGKQLAQDTRATVPNDPKKKYRTPRAAAQFKSPLTIEAAQHVAPFVKLTPTIQALERQLQLLKQAVKVKENGDEGMLEGLVTKWTEAGREVAWELWSIVKDNGVSDAASCTGQIKGTKRPFADSWGWDGQDGNKKGPGERDRGWGWDQADTGQELIVEHSQERHPNLEDEGEVEKRDTLGTMLMQLGIAPETIGWNENEESFIDV